MPTEIRIPEVSATRDTTIPIKWLKREGDEVREGEPIWRYRHSLGRRLARKEEAW